MLGVIVLFSPVSCFYRGNGMPLQHGAVFVLIEDALHRCRSPTLWVTVSVISGCSLVIFDHAASSGEVRHLFLKVDTSKYMSSWTRALEPSIASSALTGSSCSMSLENIPCHLSKRNLFLAISCRELHLFLQRYGEGR